MDKLGALASAVCAVHCLLTGVALGLLSVAGLGFVGSLATDIVFFVVAVSVGTLAIVHGLRKHHSILPALVFVSGIGMFLLGHFAFGEAHRTGPWSAERIAQLVLSVAGGLCIVMFHVVNLRLQRACGCSHCATGQ